MELITTATTLLGLILIGAGVLLCLDMRKKKKNPDYIGGIVDTVTKEDDGYKVRVGYCIPGEDMKFVDIHSDRIPIGKYVKLDPENDMKIYKADIQMSVISIVLFIVGAILCAI